MASQTQGIQQLLAAEKKAADKVSESRKRKARRLKQAKDEATDEIERFRSEREKAFKDFEAKHVGSREGVASKIDTETQKRINDMERQVANTKERVIEEMLDHVYDILPELHKNFQKASV